jgi:hypothetical protein
VLKCDEFFDMKSNRAGTNLNSLRRRRDKAGYHFSFYRDRRGMPAAGYAG